jgi:hypothetical protein
MSHDSIQYLAVRIDRNALMEMRTPRTPLTVVSRDDVLSIELVRASESAHPVIQTAFGMTLIGIGLIPVPVIILHGAVSKPVLALFVMVGLGAYLIYDAWRRVPLLRVKTIRGTARLAFRSRVDPEQLRAFIREAEETFGYSIEVNMKW